MKRQKQVGERCPGCGRTDVEFPPNAYKCLGCRAVAAERVAAGQTKKLGNACPRCKRTDVLFSKRQTRCKSCQRELLRSWRQNGGGLDRCECGAPKHTESARCGECFHVGLRKGAQIDGKKQCNKCNQWLPVNAFSRNSKRFDGLNSECRECQKKRQHVWKSTISGVSKWLQCRYGITIDKWMALYRKQRGCCATCRRRIRCLALDGTRVWDDTGEITHTDHDHDTGDVRGLLCRWCNAVVNKHMTADALRNCAAYLERWHRHADPVRGEPIPRTQPLLPGLDIAA